MARQGRLYDIAGDGSTTTHIQATSTAAADVKTLTPPAGASACLLTVSTTDGYFTFDGETPSSTAGLPIQKNQPPLLIPFARVIKFASTASANCVVNVLWLS